MGVDRLDKPENVVQIMNDVFRMNDRAEEFLYLIFCDHIIIGRDTYYSMRAERKI